MILGLPDITEHNITGLEIWIPIKNELTPCAIVESCEVANVANLHHDGV